MMLHTKYQDSRPCDFRQKDLFNVFPIYAYVKRLTPGVEPFLTPGALFEQTW